MNDPTLLEPWEQLNEAVKSRTSEELLEVIDEIPPGDVPLAISRLPEETQAHILTALPPENAAGLIEQLSNVQAADLIELLEPRQAATIIDELPSDEQADLLGDLDQRDATAIMALMHPDEAADARTLTRYEDEVAGGLMVTEFLQYQENLTVGDVVEDMRLRAEEYRDYDVQYAYVSGPDRTLTGVLKLRDLLLADRAQPIEEIMLREPLSVRDTTALEDLVGLFERYHYLGIPVTDEYGHIMGVVQQSAVDEAWGDRQDSDFLKAQGIVGGEEIRTMPLWVRSRRRLAWLSVNILLNVMAAGVIALFQDTLAAVIALAVFLPIISDMSGCSGSQAVAVSLRELSLGLVRPNELLRVWLKEISVGLINGVVLGLLIAAVAWLWKANPYLGFVVGVALCLNTLVAVSIGGLVPLLLKRFSIDPAIASGPILTTITDMCGFFFVLGIATLLLNYLQ